MIVSHFSIYYWDLFELEVSEVYTDNRNLKMMQKRGLWALVLAMDGLGIPYCFVKRIIIKNSLLYLLKTKNSRNTILNH